MVTFKAAKDELHRRLQAVADSFETLYPDVQKPTVYAGFPVNEPPFYIAVDDAVDTATTDGKSTGGHATLEFVVHVMCFARHSSRETASNTLLSYVDAVFNAVLADQRLKGAVDNSFPSVEAAGTSADNSKYYMSAASVAVRCTVFARCPREFKEAVK